MPLSDALRTAATRLLAQYGPEGFTLDDLAREAGVSRATLYRQVGGRDAVLAALAEQGVDVGPRPASRERILAAARGVFTRAGFDAATLEDIAQEAGVGPATLYRQFGDKPGLIRAFAEHLGPRRALGEVALQPSGDLRADLERVAATSFRYALEDLDLLKLALIERLRGGPWAELLQGAPSRAQRLVHLLAPYAARGLLAPEEPRHMAQAFTGMIFSFVLESMVRGGPPPDPDETARFITRVFLDGLASPQRKKP